MTRDVFSYSSRPRAVQTGRVRGVGGLTQGARATKKGSNRKGAAAGRGGPSDEQRKHNQALMSQTAGARLQSTGGPQDEAGAASRSGVPPRTRAAYNYVPTSHIKEDEVPLESYLVEKEAHVRQRECGNQTDEFVPRPPSPAYVPVKTGVDNVTQTEDEDGLFQFDVEVAPMLEVLIAKTLEQSLYELEMEAQLQAIDTDHEQQLEVKREEAAEKQALEDTSRREFEEKEERKRVALQALAEEHRVMRRVCALGCAQEIVPVLTEQVFNELYEDGTWTTPVERQVRDNFMPWLMDEVVHRSKCQHAARQLADEILGQVEALQAKQQAAALAASPKKPAPAGSPAKNPVSAVFPQLRTGKVKLTLSRHVTKLPEDTEVLVRIEENDTVADVDKKIAQSLQDAGFGDVDLPQEGCLRAAFGSVLSGDQRVLDESMPKGGELRVQV